MYYSLNGLGKSTLKKKVSKAFKQTSKVAMVAASVIPSPIQLPARATMAAYTGYRSLKAKPSVAPAYATPPVVSAAGQRLDWGSLLSEVVKGGADVLVAREQRRAAKSLGTPPPESSQPADFPTQFPDVTPGLDLQPDMYPAPSFMANGAVRYAPQVEFRQAPRVAASAPIPQWVWLALGGLGVFVVASSLRSK